MCDVHAVHFQDDSITERNSTMYQTRNYPYDPQLHRLGTIHRARRRRELAGRIRLLVGRMPRPRPANAR
jgi:hypothetical protein